MRSHQRSAGWRYHARPSAAGDSAADSQLARPCIFAAAAMVTSYASFCEVSRGPKCEPSDLAQAARVRARTRGGKREKPRPRQVRGSRAETSPRFWLIVMMEGNAARALSATAANPKTIWCDISAKAAGGFWCRRFEFRKGPVLEYKICAHRHLWGD